MNDIERKVFRIIFNKTLSHQPVTLKQLKIKTGRTEKKTSANRKELNYAKKD
ncbi:hypothetical protein ABES25_22550 [Bacillus gobiensis]|uniref:hypothetical protein n=1 Tax=Bacillus gobiensis TaxID=1441095 RepID=UPI003D2013D6